MVASLRWGFALLLAVLILVPARTQPPASEEEKKKQIEAIEKQIAELQAKLTEAKKAPVVAGLPPDVSNKFPWRCIGPANMSGRITSIAVNEADPTNFWVATASGGLLKTINNATTFDFQFDNQTVVSIGDVAVAPSNPSIVWVGSGEANPRNSVSYGDGVYKSIDGGKTWKNMGLTKTFQIGKIAIHPKNPDIVYVAALGRLYGPNEERGVFQTEDGGKTWKKVLYLDDKTGAMEVLLDPHDPNTLIASMWERKRDEFDGFFGPPPVPDAYGPIVTHSANSGLHKSTDGGKTWKKLSSGLPTSKIGRIGLDFSRKTPGLLYAILDTDKGGTGPAATTYFGAVIDTEGGAAKLSDVSKDSPAEKGGLQSGDLVVKVDDTKIETAEALIDYFQSKAPGDKIRVKAKRGEKEIEGVVTLGKKTETTPPAAGPPTAGFRFTRGEKLIVEAVVKGSAAEKGGLLAKDELQKVDDTAVTTLEAYQKALAGKKVGDKVKLTVLREKENKVLEIVLGPPATTGPPRGQSAAKPYGMGLGGQQPNVQRRQGKDGFQTGGVFRSKDNGETWERVNSLNPRPMYFSVVRIDPTDDKTIYILGDVPVLWKSTDGGGTFSRVDTTAGVHADAHAFWINPANPRHMIIGCDGGLYISYDKGAKWDHLNTLALGQFYSVTVDNKRPYRVYGGLQDNGSWGGPSDTLRRSGPVNEDWIFVSGGDGFVCRVDPTDSDLVYSESQGGFISRRNYRTGEGAGIRPQRKEGDEPLRFNWNTPYILSSHNPSIFYSAAQFVFRSVKKGDDQKPISPELTRSKAGSIVALAESPKNPDILWAGTDDGFLWITKDGGLKWENVTANLQKAGLTGFKYISTIETSREKEGRAYVAVDGHRSDDDKPYLFVTEDFGATWKPITSNLPAFGSTRCLREDIVNPNLLYCGTEFGAFASIDRGAHWTKLGSGLPTVACHEFAQPTTANELVVATHGRSVWILDINALRQMKPDTWKTATLFTPAPATRWRIGASGESPYSSTDRKFYGTNPTRGATFDVYLTQPAKAVSLKVLDVSGKVVWEYKPPTGNPKPITQPGLHRVTWNLNGNAVGGGRPGGRPLQGGQVPPGAYKLVLNVDDKEFTQPLTVELDPNAPKDLVSTEGVLDLLEAERKARKKEGRLDD